MEQEYRVTVTLTPVDGPREVTPTVHPQWEVRLRATGFDAAVDKAHHLVKLAMDDSVLHATQVSPA